VFVTECEFDDVGMKGTTSIGWRYVSAFRKHQSMKLRLIPLNQLFPNCAPRSISKCSAKRLKKKKINVTRSEDCEFVRP
jgi:hypothetical protein